MELETELALKAIRYYTWGSRFHPKRLSYATPKYHNPVHFQVLGSTMCNIPIAAYSLNTLHEWTNECGRLVYKDHFIHNELTRIVASISTFDIFVDIYMGRFENEEYLDEFTRSLPPNNTTARCTR